MNKNMELLHHHLSVAKTTAETMIKLESDQDAIRHLADSMQHALDSACALSFLIRERVKRPMKVATPLPGMGSIESGATGAASGH